MERLITRLFQGQKKNEGLDFEATEMAIRDSAHQVGGLFLEKLLNADSGGHRGTRIACGAGHDAEFVDYRTKAVLSVLSPVEIKRAYYHCPECGVGIVPKDRDLDIVGTSFSPGVRRMMARVGAKESFDDGREDLAELAGITVTAKEVERVSETLGRAIELTAGHEKAQAFSGKVIPMTPVIRQLYIAIDGTGVPVVPRESAGRKGKHEEGKSKTREAKLGCVFTQTTVDEDGYPVRDEDSTTYVGAIETAEECGKRIYAEAVRRGLHRAEKVILLGDAAAWIRGIAEEHFPEAIQIVDLFHAREHLALLGKLFYGVSSQKGKEWTQARSDDLDDGAVEKVLAAMRCLKPASEAMGEELRKTMGYFENNIQRMRYADFREQGLFVGSGVVEAGCKAVIGHRLKQSGMRWSVQGANAIIALRCCQISGRWEEFWENRVAS